jgi:hypothetical protein
MKIATVVEEICCSESNHESCPWAVCMIMWYTVILSICSCADAGIGQLGWGDSSV